MITLTGLSLHRLLGGKDKKKKKDNETPKAKAKLKSGALSLVSGTFSSHTLSDRKKRSRETGVARLLAFVRSFSRDHLLLSSPNLPVIPPTTQRSSRIRKRGGAHCNLIMSCLDCHHDVKVTPRDSSFVSCLGAQQQQQQQQQGSSRASLRRKRYEIRPGVCVSRMFCGCTGQLAWR